MAVSNGEVRRSEIGACIQVPDFDPELISAGVRYVDNGTNLDFRASIDIKVEGDRVVVVLDSAHFNGRERLAAFGEEVADHLGSALDTPCP